MPPQLQALLENRNALIAGGAALVLLLLLVVSVAVNSGGKPKDPGSEPLGKNELGFLQKVNKGKALEIQATLARQKIRVDVTPGTGDNVDLSFSPETTLDGKDRAIITLVESGLQDGHLGMEAFDTSDLMASRDEKRIKLLRAQQGELARLIRKIKPIEDANVQLSIPEETIFSKDQKPMTASVQVTIGPGDRLTSDKTRAIINLVVGSIQGLEAKNVALADTNGNTYNSVLDAADDLQNKAAEQDTYMKQKVASQLDKLVGPGHYVVTVSTELREAPRETMVQSFDPSRSAVSSKQRFEEKLGTGGSGATGGAVSSFLAPDLEKTSSMQSGNKGYNRDGVEVTYENGRTQWVETSVPGMVEAISVAVTIDYEHFPNMAVADLQQLLAHAASPKVLPQNVSIARTDFQESGPAVDAGANATGNDSANTLSAWLTTLMNANIAGIPLVLVAGGALGLFLLFVLLLMAASTPGRSMDTRIQQQAQQQAYQTQQEIEALKQWTAQQQAQQQEMLMSQQQQTQQLLANQQQQLLATQQQQAVMQDTTQLQRALAELKQTLATDDLSPEMLERPVKTWIETR